ncbi:MAG: phage holin family protein [Actinomycetota bacterium]|nr:phage holin family protein [Actinomycetota bacterium]
MADPESTDHDQLGRLRRRRRRKPPHEESLGDLVKQLSEQSADLARKEVELAKAEMSGKAKRYGIGAGAFGGAGLFGLFAFAAITAAAILLLATAIDAWLAAVIIGAVYASIAGILALLGKKQVEEAGPPVPEQAIDSTKSDVNETQQRIQEARR